MTAGAEGRYPVTEAEEGVRGWIAYSVDCPECDEPAGFRCIYTSGPETAVSAYGRPRDYIDPRRMHLRGDMTIRPHFSRSDKAAAVLARQRSREVPAPGRPSPDLARSALAGDAGLARDALAEFDRRKWRRQLAERDRAEPPRPVVHEVIRALHDFDAREYAALRDWLRLYGEILWTRA